MAAVELCPGNLVNPQVLDYENSMVLRLLYSDCWVVKIEMFITFVQIKEKLLMKHVLDHEKQRLISEIARDCFQPAILALEYCPDWHQKQVILLISKLCLFLLFISSNLVMKLL